MSRVTEYDFHVAGRHAVTGVFELLDCDGHRELVVRGHLEVRPGIVTPNMSFPPTAVVGISEEPVGANYGRSLDVLVTDRDGFLHSARFDFGDGSEPQTVSGEIAACRDHPARPVTFRSGRTGVLHYFPDPGEYTVRVVATTTDCEGTNPQTVTAERTVTLQEWRP